MKSLENKTNTSDEKEIEEGLKSTRALIQSFLQTLKAYRLYEANHPILSKFLDRLRRDFDHYFDEFDIFTLNIGKHQLFYRGKVVYENQDVKESLAFVFFKDGIRELQFSKGLEFKEIVDFLHIVRKGDFVNRMEDDLVTLLWEKDFSHLSFTAADEFLQEGDCFVPATGEDLLKGLEYTGFGGEEVKETSNEGETVAGNLKQLLNPSPGQSLVQACMLNPDEIEMIDREVHQEQQPEFIYVLVNNLIEILLHLGEDIEAHENMVSYFDRVIESLLEQKEIGRAVAILNSLNDTLESMVLKDTQIFPIRRIFEKLSNSHSIELLGNALRGNGELESESILQYLRFLTKQAVEPLCVLLGELESGKWKKVICDRLAELCREEIQPLTKYLLNPNSFLICHILHILEKIGHPSTVKYLGNLVVHEDPKVREEALQVLNKFGEKGRDLIQKFLRDSVPRIRAKAALILARMAKSGAVKPLTEIILSEDFYKRDYEEKASFFRAIGETGYKEAIPILRKISEKRSWFQKEKWSEMRLCATNALKMMEAHEINPVRKGGALTPP